MHQFFERHPNLHGFSAYYARELFPQLSTREGQRQAAVSKLIRDGAIVGTLILLLIVFLWLRFQNVHLTTLLVFMGGAGILALAKHHLTAIKSDTKNILVSGICKFVGWKFSETVSETPDIDLLIQNGLLPRHYDRVKFEDEMSGAVHGADFNALECHLERKVQTRNGTRWVTTFRGALVVIDFHRTFSGKTVVLRDAGIFNSKSKMEMKRVGLVDPVFEKIFEAYGTDQVEARYLLTPDFMQRLIDLEKSVDGSRIRFGFLNDLLLIVVETPDRFEAGSMMKALTDTERTQKILDEVTAVYGVVDGVMKPQSVPDRFKT